MRHVCLLLSLALVALLVAPLAAAPVSERPELDDQEVEVLLDTAVKLRAGLAKLRQLEATPANAKRRAELQEKVRRDLDTFLETAGLTADDFVRLLDRDGLSNGKDADEKPQLRTLEEVER